MWYVYVLKSKMFNKYYTGCTKNLQRRIQEHNTGFTSSVKKYIPYELVYFEKYDNQEESYEREKQIKSYKGSNAFKRLLVK